MYQAKLSTINNDLNGQNLVKISICFLLNFQRSSRVGQRRIERFETVIRGFYCLSRSFIGIFPGIESLNRLGQTWCLRI